MTSDKRGMTNYERSMMNAQLCVIHHSPLLLPGTMTRSAPARRNISCRCTRIAGDPRNLRTRSFAKRVTAESNPTPALQPRDT
jgi:hypothetical protein